MRTNIKRITKSFKGFSGGVVAAVLPCPHRLTSNNPSSPKVTSMVTSIVSKTRKLMLKATLALAIWVGATFVGPIVADSAGINVGASTEIASVPLTAEQVTANVWPAVVRIESGWKLGSGFIIGSEGLVLTNNHVIWDVNDITISLTDGTSFAGTVQNRHYALDLAVIKIEASGLPTVKLADSGQTPLGSEVLVVGFPLPDTVFTVTRGIASAFKFDPYNEALMIQTDAAVNPGNSGGPLLDREGQVIGIVTRKTVDVEIEGVGLAISSNTVKGYLDTLAEGR